MNVSTWTRLELSESIYLIFYKISFHSIYNLFLIIFQWLWAKYSDFWLSLDVDDRTAGNNFLKGLNEYKKSGLLSRLRTLFLDLRQATI